MTRKQLEGICRFVLTFESDMSIEEVNKQFGLELSDDDSHVKALTSYLEKNKIQLDGEPKKLEYNSQLSISKQIILEELNENQHPEKVEDVIFWALEYYSQNRKEGSWGECIAYAIKQRILDAEKGGQNA